MPAVTVGEDDIFEDEIDDRIEDFLGSHLWKRVIRPRLTRRHATLLSDIADMVKAPLDAIRAKQFEAAVLKDLIEEPEDFLTGRIRSQETEDDG